MSFDWRASQAAAHRFRNPSDKRVEADYSRLLSILEHSPTDKAAAELLGVHPSTLRRWKNKGLGSKTLDKYHSHIVQTAAKVRRRIQRKIQRDPNLREKVRPVITSRYAGELIHVYMPGADFGDYWSIIKRFQSSVYPFYSAFYFTIRFDADFAGWWDGQETTQINMGISYRIEPGGTMNTKLASTAADLHGDDDEILNTLSKYFYMQGGHIEKIVFLRMNLEGKE